MFNAKILGILNSIHYAWFWLGIWVLYYSRFGGFAAVGILETVMIVSTILFEIPTGAIGDLLGKKKTLIVAYLLSGISNIWMAFAPNLLHMCFSLVLMNFGGALRSGTFEAMLFESLKAEKKEALYTKILSSMTAGRLITLSIAGIVGGYLYTISPQLPFLLTGLVITAGTFVAMSLKDTPDEQDAFTLSTYLKQNVKGTKELFKTKEIALRSLALLSVMVVVLIMYEGLNDILSVGFGFTEVQLGIFASVLGLVGAGTSVIAGKLSEKGHGKLLYFGAIGVYLVSLLVSPFVGLVLGGMTILIRNIAGPIIENESSAFLNERIESKYRATALSAFSMLKSLPYAVTIYFISAATDVFPPAWVAFAIGGFFFFAFALNILILWPRENHVLAVDAAKS